MKLVPKPSPQCPLLREPCVKQRCAWWVDLKPKGTTRAGKFIGHLPNHPACAVPSGAATALFALAGLSDRTH